jgi:CheY-like chemotaxis protein
MELQNPDSGSRASGARGELQTTSDQYDVLIVEDDRVLAEELSELLRSEGYTVRAAGNGAEALRRLSQDRVGLLILDLMLPVVSGWELLDSIRSSQTLRELPVFIITAFANVHRAGGGPVFLKPLNVRSLVRAVRTRLGPR